MNDENPEEGHEHHHAHAFVIGGPPPHIIEQMQHNKLIRPDLNYTGPMGLPWVAVDAR